MMVLQTRPKYEDFPLKAFDKIRYADTDRQGHVNNALFSTFLETGRTELLYAKEPLHAEKASFVIASQKLDLLSEIRWPGTVEIGSAITRVGNSSFSLFQGIYQNGKLAAVAETVIVQMDDDTRKSTPLSSETKGRLKEYLVELEK
ncbi:MULTISPECIES: thioesterase family protein [unclassified Mesobacillus]|uniref:acyl-CoA thioesterase n=1 Tax=unclassified Mesobacillus TaxID=2675270 RepID=UPI00203C756F|nr:MULTISPECIES: thioesterase family protein [unclassified Mesobacillus]MCM3124454.1 acyl-CoA thioesterase [Mesobacillus sp. MER 33]